MRAKLEAVGLRSINNIVDITNFVMLELGQPLHAFDADKLQGGINVRLAQPNEKFLALDGRTYTLSPKNLVIADTERGVAIGGVMGGEDTGVTETTRHVLLESAYFLPASVRRTARELNLPSDASYRFERGVDPGNGSARLATRRPIDSRDRGRTARYRDDHRRNIAGAARPDSRSVTRAATSCSASLSRQRMRIGFSKGLVWKSWAGRTSNRAGAFPVIAPIFAAKWI